jgi:hypothetical protein
MRLSNVAANRGPRVWIKKLGPKKEGLADSGR